MKTKKKLLRTKYCERCGTLFNPTSKYSKICDRCNINNQRVTNRYKITNSHIISLTPTKINIKEKEKINDREI